MTTVRRHARHVASALLLMVALVVIGLFLLPKAFGYDLYVITTGSMRGTVDPGGLVIADRVPVDELGTGDVITYLPPAGSRVDHLVTHRITEIRQDEAGAVVYRTQGDANTTVDPWTFSLDAPVQARLSWSIPFVGRPVLWLQDPQVRTLALGVPAVAIALLALKDVVIALRPVRTPTPVVIDLTDTSGPAGLPVPTRARSPLGQSASEP